MTRNRITAATFGILLLLAKWPGAPAAVAWADGQSAANAGDESFDAAFYLRDNPDVAADKVWSKDPLGHYRKYGRYEGRRPSAGAAKAPYRDGRPAARLRIDARDQGPVLRYGDGPAQCDYLVAREAIVFESGGTYYLHYDGAGPKGWLACLATSTDLVHWTKKGPILDFGKPGRRDSATATSPWVYFDGEQWHMFYVGSRNMTPPPECIPATPYATCKAKSGSPAGPWIKQKVVPFEPKPGSYYADTASPGYVVKNGQEYLMFFSAAVALPPMFKRTLALARTKDLDGPWQVDSQPIVPLDEQIENSSLYFEPSNRTWFLFTNHIGIDVRGEFTDAVWVYWSKDLDRWDLRQKAVVVNYRNCSWSTDCIGMPAVIRVKDRLALLYDAPGGKSVSHMRRSIGLAWLELPLVPPH